MRLAISLDLRGSFEQARVNISGKALEELRHQSFIQASMRGSDDVSIGGVCVNTGGRMNQDEIAKMKEKQRMDDLVLLSMLNDQIAAIENMLSDRYGEDFAEQLAAELLSKDTYERLMKIDDKTERREAIARAINQGVKDSTIDKVKVAENPDFEKWLDAHLP